MVLNNPTAFIDPNGMGVSMWQAIDDLLNGRNEYGGTWSSSGGGSVTYFTSREDAENSASQTLQEIPDALMYAELFRRGNAMLPTVLVTGTPGHFRVDPITMSIATNSRNQWLNAISGNNPSGQVDGYDGGLIFGKTWVEYMSGRTNVLTIDVTALNFSHVSQSDIGKDGSINLANPKVFGILHLQVRLWL